MDSRPLGMRPCGASAAFARADQLAGVCLRAPGGVRSYMTRPRVVCVRAPAMPAMAAPVGKDGRYDGMGKYTGRRGDSDEYEGQWRADKPHGCTHATDRAPDRGLLLALTAPRSFACGADGRYLYRDSGDVYEGQWVQGLREGDGRVLCANGDVYEGLYECGERVRVALSRESFLTGTDERGVRIRMFTATITCERITKADLEKAWYDGESVPAPEGCATLLPGRMRHGHGKMHHDCGNTYVGGFEYDERSGVGTYTYACGDTYVGEWKNGPPARKQRGPSASVTRARRFTLPPR